jgi:hypothetical protein
MQIKRLTQFHEDPELIKWWCTRLASLLNWLTPARRRWILIVGAVYVSLTNPLSYLQKAHEAPTNWLSAVLVLLVLLGLVWLIYQASIRYKHLPKLIQRHPQITLHLVFWIFLAAVWHLTPASGPWRAVMIGVALFFPKILWRCGYMLYSGQSNKIAGSSFMQQLICLFPVFGGTNTPYGKGLDFLSKFEAKTPEALAKSQLAGIKLLLLSGLWGLVLFVMDGLVYGSGNRLTQAFGGHTLGIPKLAQLLPQGADASRLNAWASIYCELVWQVLRMARNGHGVVAVLRLFGFNVFRNTYKPLLAESVHEFWNRYYYYFKELLVNFFFMPVFMQCNGAFFQKWQRLRLFVAIFAAAFVGNMYYHLLYKENLLLHGEIYAAIYSSRCDFFYAFLLAIGIYISMLRRELQGGKPLSTVPFARILRIFGVWTFFSLIIIWDLKSNAPFFTRLHFFLNLFGLA